MTRETKETKETRVTRVTRVNRETRVTRGCSANLCFFSHVRNLFRTPPVNAPRSLELLTVYLFSFNREGSSNGMTLLRFGNIFFIIMPNSFPVPFVP